MRGRGESALVSRAVHRAKEGDHGALAFLYARFADEVHVYVRSIVRDEHLAQHVTQEVFANVLLVTGTYEDRELPWVERVARKVAVDELRRRLPIPVQEVCFEDQRSMREDTARARAPHLRDALTTLPEGQGEVPVLGDLFGVSPTEIAQRTGPSLEL